MTGKEILTLDDVKLLVNTFYDKIRKDELLGPIFNERIQDRWRMHLDKMYTFWQTLLLEEHTYNGRPFPPHMNMPIGHEHFNHWLGMFTATVDELFTGDKAEEAKWRAANIAKMFENKLNYFRSHEGLSIL
ncbi:group III truncated hemoglobin [Mucilaginibacter sp. RS28]|uniref:Group III truncated hemoglobin n=1 Tax=Mucilaginibacter straminoryzae TaxID=2932774 RepID=A0A9X1X1Q8_9SPHI|nr:group III truncated hemoglobin [Mucilaginibacter straminoryzae]MCJ8208715.1 group III truncated hemoglobin [Mucilaginibacter straminoryzae]